MEVRGPEETLKILTFKGVDVKARLWTVITTHGWILAEPSINDGIIIPIINSRHRLEIVEIKQETVFKFSHLPVLAKGDEISIVTLFVDIDTKDLSVEEEEDKPIIQLPCRVRIKPTDTHKIVFVGQPIDLNEVYDIDVRSGLIANY